MPEDHPKPRIKPLEIEGVMEEEDSMAWSILQQAKRKGIEHYDGKDDFELIILSKSYPEHYAIPKIANHLLDVRRQKRDHKSARQNIVLTAALSAAVATLTGVALKRLPDSHNEPGQQERLEQTIPAQQEEDQD